MASSNNGSNEPSCLLVGKEFLEKLNYQFLKRTLLHRLTYYIRCAASIRRRKVKEKTEARQKGCKTAIEEIIKTALCVLDRGANPHEHVISYSVTHLRQFYCSE